MLINQTSITMKKIVTLMTLVIALSSCSNDDDKNKEEFFNLKVGNEWVYKSYTINGNQEKYSGRTDTVKVVGIENIDGKEYFKLTGSDGLLDGEALLRIDESGHLINSLGRVLHPGTDSSFTETRPANSNYDFGTTTFTLKDKTTMAVEGENYEVSPYSGYFTPYPDKDLPEGEGVVKGYSPGIGFVIKKYRYISTATGFIEYRLVSYDLE